MSASFFRDYPPYKGDEPYLCLHFHKSDSKRVKRFFDVLIQRRCRVWYSIGDVFDRAESRKNAEYEKKADLMVFWLSACAVNDKDMKSAIGYYQTTGHPIICIDTRTCEGQSGFSLVLSPDIPQITYTPDMTTEELVLSLMRTEGFTQRLIAENDHVRQTFLRKRKLRQIMLCILLAVMLSLGGATVYAKNNGWFYLNATTQDSVIINDSQIERAARFALSPDGEAALTKESLARITVLRLYNAPSSFDELALLPALSRLEIPQGCVETASALLDNASFTIVVYPEADDE